MFQRISSSFPESCLNGDVASIRRAVASEKGRLKKLQQREQKALEAGVTPWVSSAATAVAGSGVGPQQLQQASSSSSSKKAAANGATGGGGSSSSNSNSSHSATKAVGPSSSAAVPLFGSDAVTSPVKKTVTDLTKEASNEGPKILIANPQKLEINGRVYASKMLAIPGLSVPAKVGRKDETSATVGGSQSAPAAAAAAAAAAAPTPMARVASEETVGSDGYWSMADLIAEEEKIKRAKESSKSATVLLKKSSGTTSSVSESIVRVDESTESFMMKYLL